VRPIDMRENQSAAGGCRDRPKVDGELRDLATPIEASAAVEILTSKNPRRSPSTATPRPSARGAVLELYPETKLGIALRSKTVLLRFRPAVRLRRGSREDRGEDVELQKRASLRACLYPQGRWA